MKLANYLLLGLLLLIVAKTDAQWVQTNGPLGANVRALVVSGTNLFAGVGPGGTYLSTDNGTTWRPVNYGMIDSWGDAVNVVSSLAVADSVIFAATAGGGVFLSTNNGTQWDATGFPINYVNAVGVGNGYVFAGTSSGIHRRTVDTWGWSAVLAGSYVTSFVFSGTTAFAGTYGGGVLRSTDNGTNWSAVNTGLTNSNVRSLLVSGTNIYAGTDSGLFLSTNDGASWSSIGLEYQSVYALLASGPTLFAGTRGNGAFRTTDGGAHWTSIDAGMGKLTVNCFALSGTRLFAGTEGGGVFFSTDNGTQWITTNAGLTKSYVFSLAASAADLFAATTGGVYRSTDSGENWITVNNGLTNLYIENLLASGTTLIAAPNASEYAPSSIFRSTDKGDSWTSVSDSLVTSGLRCLCNANGNIFAGTLTGVVRSTDGGLSWSRASSGLPSDMVTSIVYVSTGGQLFAGTFSNGVYRSTDGGTTWRELNSGRTYQYMSQLAVMGNYLFAVTDAGLFRTTIDGGGWVFLRAAELDWIVAIDGGKMIVGTWRDGVFFSDDSGATWHEANTGLVTTWGASYSRYITTGIRSLLVSGTNLYAGTGNDGVWRRPLAEMVTGVTEAPREMPSDFALEQNYPNPFNPVTQIYYTIGQEKDLGTMGLGEGERNVLVQLIVYDLLGRQVATLVNEAQGPGRYEVKFDGTGLASGIYFYRLQTENFFESKRMILLR